MDPQSGLKIFKPPDNIPKNQRKKLIIIMKAMERHIEARNGEEYKWSLSDFEIGRLLGKGGFAHVYLVREKATKIIFALKVLNKSGIVKSKSQVEVIREIEIQAHLKHPHIIKLLTYFSTDSKIYMVLEFAGGGELFEHLQKQPNNCFAENKAARYIYQVAKALYYCHQNKVIHRDIKPENLFLTIDGNIKLADFGLSVHAPSSKRDTVCGTLDYLPPEMIQSVQYNEKVDNWSLGVLCYEFLCGKPPFESANTKTTRKKILNVDIRWPSVIPPGAKDLISKLLRLRPEDRLPLSDVLEHFWIVENKDL